MLLYLGDGLSGIGLTLKLLCAGGVIFVVLIMQSKMVLRRWNGFLLIALYVFLIVVYIALPSVAPSLA